MELGVFGPLITRKLVLCLGGPWLAAWTNHVVSSADIISYEGVQWRVNLARLDVFALVFVASRSARLNGSFHPT